MDLKGSKSSGMPVTALRSSESALRRRDEPALIFCPSSIQLIRTVLYNSVLGDRSDPPQDVS